LLKAELPTDPKTTSFSSPFPRSIATTFVIPCGAAGIVFVRENPKASLAETIASNLASDRTHIFRKAFDADNSPDPPAVCAITFCAPVVNAMAIHKKEWAPNVRPDFIFAAFICFATAPTSLVINWPRIFYISCDQDTEFMQASNADRINVGIRNRSSSKFQCPAPLSYRAATGYNTRLLFDLVNAASALPRP